MSLIATTVVLAAENHEEEVNWALNWAVGGGILFILLFAMGMLLAFGGGREHS